MEDIISLLIVIAVGGIFLILIAVISLSVGIFLGAFLGKPGSLELLNFILNLPVFLFKSPKKLKTYWKMWQEMRALKKMDILERRNQIKSVREEINSKKEEFRKLKTQMRRLKWEG